MRKTSALIFSLLGLFASSYLWWMYTSPSVPMVCMGQGCEVVRASRYAHVYGIPTPVFGVLMYTTLVLALLAEPMVSPRLGLLLRRAVLAISAAGVLASLYLTVLEAFIIHAYCMWCVVQAVSVALVLVSLWKARTGYSDTEAALRGVRRQSLTLLLAAIVGVPSFLFLQQKAKVPPAALPAASEQAIAEHLLRTDSHVLGNPGAPVTIIEFGDLQCASCAAANRSNHELQARFGNKVRFVFRHFPMSQLHRHALKAAEASECAAEQGRFWEAVDRFYKSEGKLDDSALRRYASELGLDTHRFNACLSSGATAARVRRDADDGRFLGVRSTPTFIVGRQMIEGVLDTERFAQVIDTELAKVAAPSTTSVATSAAPAPAENARTDKASNPAPTPKSNATVAATTPEPAGNTRPGNPVPVAPTSSPLAVVPGFQQSASPFAMLQGSSGCETNATPVPQASLIHTREARELHQAQSVFVDVRSREEFARARIAGAISMPISEVERRVRDLPRDRTIVLYESGQGSGDDTCAVSRSAARVLTSRGFQKVKVYQEGLAAWEKAGLPVQR